MEVLDFVQEMKERAPKELLMVSGIGKRTETTCKFKIGHADIVMISGGAIEKAAITHMVFRGLSIDKLPGSDMGVKYSCEEERADGMVYQMEVFPENPYCPMGHFNTA